MRLGFRANPNPNPNPSPDPDLGGEVDAAREGLALEPVDLSREADDLQGGGAAGGEGSVRRRVRLRLSTTGARACLVAGNALLLAQVAPTSLAWPALLLIAKEAGRRHQASNPTRTIGREVRSSSGAQVHRRRPRRRRRPRLRDGQVRAQRDGVVAVLARHRDVQRHAAQVRHAGLRKVRESGYFVCVLRLRVAGSHSGCAPCEAHPQSKQAAGPWQRWIGLGLGLGYG